MAPGDSVPTATSVAHGNLLRVAPADEIKAVISAYNPEALHSVNVDSLNNVTTIERNLKPCATFLKVPPSALTGLKKDGIIDVIILYIESYYPMNCDACSTSYRTDIEAKSEPLLRCLLCHQGCHDCPTMTTKANKFLEHKADLPSTCSWICHACFIKNHSPAATGRASVPAPSTPAAPPSNPSQAVPTPKSELTLSRETAGVCPLYTLGTCPHGISGNRLHNDVKCQFLHPKRCKPFCRNGPNGRYGCSKASSSCPKFHPVLCTGSLSNKECFNESCTSTHLKGTKRKKGGPARRPPNPTQHDRRSNRDPPSRTNISQSRPLPSNPASATSAPAPELSFLANTVQVMLQEFATLRRDLLQSGPTLPSSQAPHPQPSHQPSHQHPHQPSYHPPAQTHLQPPALFGHQRPVLHSSQPSFQFHSSQPSHPSSSQPPLFHSPKRYHHQPPHQTYPPLSC